ncbi:hypothetical protein CI238_11660 [Colletotrichum incanum]|uniref:Uncharacterized protein n=1 Tax=Colletotrichum incanum TaxID=1573173 RepID=A0A167D4D2_COLIC|nr:hypothetical protein CI238_11660 [Colletotrichum incanum]
MRFITVIVPTVLSLAASCHAWTQAADGTWIANNNYYWIRGVHAHEACTRRNTEDIIEAGPCAYWYNSNGGIYRGTYYILTK